MPTNSSKFITDLLILKAISEFLNSTFIKDFVTKNLILNLLQSNLFITDTKGDRDKCLHYRGVCFREVGFIWVSGS